MPMTAGDRMNGRMRTCAGACSPPGWDARETGLIAEPVVRSLLVGHPGDIGAEVEEAAERSPFKRDVGADGVCRRRYNQSQRRPLISLPSNFGFRIQLISKFGKGVVATQSDASQGGLYFSSAGAYERTHS